MRIAPFSFSAQLSHTVQKQVFSRPETRSMKYAFLITLAAVLGAGAAHAQTRIYRCGNTYTNDVNEAQAKGCKPLDGGNLTVVQGTKVQASGVRPTSAAPSPSAPGGTRIDAGDQRARDADARQILEAELAKAQARHAELLREYNNGEPERRGDERNYQKYLDRVQRLKDDIARTESAIASLKRELAGLRD